ncbi:DUF3108 domain-containing protein [Microvirga roseola]|uniref:DUF3108 domain-containing protein n=1 Tax=Microvirga roseola TaxID=2883126 RepID=UPI001E38131B|nr:DUF3108 domain-containing protein [Microvirga roseola]
MRLFASALVASILAGIGSQAHAQTLKVDYDLSLAGLPLGTAALSSTFAKKKYQVEGSVRLSGLVRLLTGVRGEAMARGVLSEERPKPASFAVISISSSDQRRVKMGLRSGNVAEVEIDPPLEPKPDRVPVKAVDKKRVVDPVSALLMPVTVSGDPTHPDNCNRSIPVFDGASRFDVVLSYAETRAAEVPGYSGPVLVCNARYVPISGHRAQRPGTKFMMENKDMSVWLAPVEGQRVLFPLRVSVRTMIGTSVAEASSWSVEDGAQVIRANGRRPVRAKDAVRAGASQ